MPGPAIRRRQLGGTLRQLREQRGISPKDAAKYLGVALSTINKIEKGKQAVQVAHVRLLAIFYEIGSPDLDALLRLTEEANERGWWATYGDTVPQWFRDYIGLESDASELRTWHPDLLHGLLQTPAYMRAVITASRPDHPPSEVDRLVELRRARQRILTRHPAPLKLTAVIGEGAVRRLVGGEAVMREQLEHLIELGDGAQIAIRVLPFTVGAHAAMVSPFTLLAFPAEDGEPDAGPEAVYLENERGGLFQERPGDIGRYLTIWRRVEQAAHSSAETRELLASLTAHLRKH
ncbi:helix-turn-helix domain-containing protein [Actinoalloteichus fjordicus]|uniref:Helix-turn-helix protein n=1 Tax=Actinoalloteichus fjordicus TaxID=1612552 RepID=A0AAC9PTZ6_9PSEU|nr:Scr1 family TA system antitoxin-like transcriptional regulator [Actinoalloteichus fjordicus]APU16535.1 Helix-turn-helix protein [Actinoalloteichus fjordicus]